MMYYQYIVLNPFYELKYDVTVYNQFFMMLSWPKLFTIYSHTIFPAPNVFIRCHFFALTLFHLLIQYNVCIYLCVTNCKLELRIYVLICY